MMWKLPRTVLALVMALSLTGLPLPGRAAPEAAPEATPAVAAAHAKTVAAARAAEAQAAVAREAGANGPGEAYRVAIVQYGELYYAVRVALRDEAEVQPDVVARKAESDAVYARYRALKVSPVTADRDMMAAENQRRETWAAYETAREEALARVKAKLAAEGLALPEPTSPDLFAKGMTEPLFPDLPPVGVHGFVFTPFTAAPWQVELQWADADSAKPPLTAVDYHSCGGALIAADWVLTAAHCVWDRKAGRVHPLGDYRVRAGGTSLTGALAIRAIDRIVLPTGARAYVPSDAFSPAKNDIALLHLARPLKLGPDVAVVSYARSGVVIPQDTQGLTVSGWGATEAESFGDQTARVGQGGVLKMSAQLRFAPLDLIDNADCFGRIKQGIQDVYPSAQVGALTPSSMCAGSQLTGTCVGDSGGPLVLHTTGALAREARRRDGEAPAPADRPVLVGVVSWGVGCENFTVFTRVSSYADWIAATIRPPPRRPMQRS